ncbi:MULTISPECIES: LysE family translocator [Serratia]|uniref:LysE family transporter n=2 Tax=Serratia TaxID=613 RepID=A0AAW6WYZ4_9GAMM|nr:MULTISPECIES: LysE family transporter [Serratia]AKL39693.1 amino acid transporter [Serratia marcescens]AUY14654.1 amino acid transporter [Serratia sp. SSNIH1]AVU35101.1 amino acid transporter [Serratia marcescens]AVU40206.1 amino acid transporter [Serratia marcescens]AWL66915.1 amino acid transporter [Serratia marcescens]
MIDMQAVLAVFTVYIVGVVIPGPNFVAVAHKAVSARRSEAFALVAGIVLVNLFWASSALLGVGIIFALFPWLALAVKVAGAGYLLWFGYRLIAQAAPSSGPSTVTGKSGFRVAFLQGIATNIANPKSIAFYAAVFSSAAPAHVSMPTFAAMLLEVAVVASLWYGLVALVLSHAPIASAYRRSKAWIDRACGVLIISLGIRQLFSR